MNIMKMLSQLEWINEEEKRMRLEAERLETKAQGLGGSAGEELRRSAEQDRMANAAIKDVMEKDKQAFRKREFTHYRQVACRLFWTLEDNAQAYVLDLTYIRGMSVREIADEIGMSKSWVDRKRVEGIRKLSGKRF